jgi:hypothetical protein
MSLSNLVLTYDPIRKALLELETLSKGSPYEQEAICFFMDKTFRKLNSDVPDNIVALCKAETLKAFPNASEKEAAAIMKARNERVQTLTIQLKNDTVIVIRGVIDGVVEKAIENFTERFNDLFSDYNLDVFLDYKLSQLEPSLSKAILESTRTKTKEVKQN